MALSAPAVGCGSRQKSSGPTFHAVLTTSLSGKAEVPAGSRSGSGSARITLKRAASTACWTLTVKGIGRPLSAHVHKASADKIGPVVIPLGARFAADGCVVIPGRILRAVGSQPGAYYVNVHTNRYLNGAIRGQLQAG